jgi:two-component system, NtrC family, response regulator HydG
VRARDLKLSEIIQFGDHQVGLSGRRLVLHDMHAFAQFRKDIVDSVGLEQARRMFTRFGTFWGEADAAAMKRLFRWDSPEELLLAGPRMHSLQGVTRAVVKSLSLDRSHFTMEVTWHDSGEADEHLLELGPATEPVCWMLVGYATGYATYCLGQRIYFVEQRCRGCGDRTCTALGRDEAAWGDALAPQRGYFEADKIIEKVQKLSLEIQKKQQALERAQHQAGELGDETETPLVEVRSVGFRRILELATRVARYDSSVLITGESGTGKEVLARFLHARSPRSAEPFLGVNCASLPDSLLESELFGHKAGAFTGAVRDRVGLFEAAGKGTVFLDEIGEVSPAMQVKLLRVLQEREVVRLGENRPRQVKARILAATNRKLSTEVRAGRFREDLYYRLRVVELEVPPLRERRDDILPLARHFVGRLADKLGLPDLRLDASALDALLDYPWPGNVRELENALERAAVLSRGNVITRNGLPSEVRRNTVSQIPGDRAERSLAEVEREHIELVLDSTGHNRARAAHLLGIGPTTLWRKLKAYERAREKRQRGRGVDRVHRVDR